MLKPLSIWSQMEFINININHFRNLTYKVCDLFFDLSTDAMIHELLFQYHLPQVQLVQFTIRRIQVVIIHVERLHFKLIHSRLLLYASSKVVIVFRWNTISVRACISCNFVSDTIFSLFLLLEHFPTNFCAIIHCTLRETIDFISGKCVH